jgi:hypothetical protein
MTLCALKCGHVVIDRVACIECMTVLRQTIFEIESYAELLQATKRVSPLVIGVRRVAVFGSISPGDDTVIAAFDSRTVCGSDDVVAVVGTVQAWAAFLRMERGEQPRAPQFTRDVRYLRDVCEWAGRLPCVGDLAEALEYVHSYCRHAARDAPPTPLGACFRCATGAVYLQDAGTAQCDRCNQRYGGLELLQYADADCRFPLADTIAILHSEADRTGDERFRIRASTVRIWVHRGHITRGPLYDLGEIRAHILTGPKRSRNVSDGEVCPASV